ncbi:MAG: hypothetical protein M0037_13060 [Betaproteobacteria bacterium]|nr:hypothetical protein [Betaproteobacteria bacterium]
MRRVSVSAAANAKKPLSQRWHRLGGDDVIVQRDCYSAFLAKHATEDGHSSSRLEEGWAVAQGQPHGGYAVRVDRA